MKEKLIFVRKKRKICEQDNLKKNTKNGARKKERKKDRLGKGRKKDSP